MIPVYTTPADVALMVPEVVMFSAMILFQFECFILSHLIK